ncbi:MAG: hypothetical protein AB9869_32680 [Verrucomicrobiia bacterium]
MNVIPSTFAICLLALSSLGAEPELVYQNNFEKAELDQVPEDLLVLDGGFAVKQENDNKFLELPGDPLDTYGVLFGPSEKDGISASARVFGTGKGRRYPTFALGLNGVGGYRVKVSPGKKALELFRGDTFKASVPYQWQPGTWTYLRLQVSKTSAGTIIQGKAWPDGKAEPADWMISTTETEELPAGRASVFGSPFSGTPIRYDDLAVMRLRP